MSTVRYWAAAKAAAGTAQEVLPARTLAELLTRATSGRDERFAAVLGSCSYLVDGDPVGAREHAGVAVADASTVDVLPPFAGG